MKDIVAELRILATRARHIPHPAEVNAAAFYSARDSLAADLDTLSRGVRRKLSAQRRDRAARRSKPK